MVKRDPKTIAEAVEMTVQWLSTRPRGVVVSGDGEANVADNIRANREILRVVVKGRAVGSARTSEL